MDEFNQNNNYEGAKNTEEVNSAPQNDYNQNEEPQSEYDASINSNTLNDDIPVWNKVEYTPVGKIEDYKPMGKGLKLFCVIMAVVVALTASTAAGYFMGRGSVSHSYIGSKVDVDLAAKPTNTDQSTPAQVYAQVNESVVGIRIYNEAGKMSDA